VARETYTAMNKYLKLLTLAAVALAFFSSVGEKIKKKILKYKERSIKKKRNEKEKKIEKARLIGESKNGNNKGRKNEIT